MSVAAVSWALQQRIKDPLAKLMLIALAEAHNEQTGRCFPSIAHLSVVSEASESTTRRRLQQLARMGVIRIDVSIASDGRQQANEYILNRQWQGVPQTGGGCQPETLRGVSGGQGEGVSLTGGGCHHADRGEGVSCDTPLKEPEEIPEDSLGASAPRQPAPADRFEEFWSAYPQREGPNPKKPARQRFERIVKAGADPDQLVAAARALSRDHPRPTRFVPQAVTFLNQERFADMQRSPAAVSRAADWPKRLFYGRREKAWWDTWGPPPDMPGTLVPRDLVRDGDGIGWQVRREAA